MMNYLSENKKFSFSSKAVAEDALGVVSFTGSEGLSRLYSFDISLVSPDADLDMDGIMREPASFFIHRPDGSKVPFHGIIARFELIRSLGSFYLYRARLVPRLWHLTLTHHNQIFLNSTARDILSQVLEDGGLSSMDYEFRLQGEYVTWEYACQYGESHFSFVCRWLERNGMYFFFDQSGESEKLVITDSLMAHAQAPWGSDLVYAPVSGLEAMHLDESVQEFVCIRQQVPGKVTLQDYNYRTPSLEVRGTAEVNASGRGEMYFYGDHFRTPEEGDKLAKIRAEEYRCREKQYQGRSTVPYLMPGYTFSLTDHFRSDMNRTYHTISMAHQGSQASFLISGIREHLGDMEQKSVYSNRFTAIEDSVQFRPRRRTARPRLHGTINGRIDAAGTGKYAEVDDQGRYKVILPFDRSGRGNGEASAWIRMMQPYGGPDHGMHFPLHKGCEVLITFIDGDPDRPVIAGAVPNPDNPSQVRTMDQTMAKLTSSGGNKLHIEDKEGEQRILHLSPTKNTWMRMGAPNDPPSAAEEETHQDPSSAEGAENQEGREEQNEIWNKEAEANRHVHAQSSAHTSEDGFAFSSEGSWNAFVGMNYKIEVGGIANSAIIGGENKFVGGETVEIVAGQEFKFLGGSGTSITVGEEDSLVLGGETEIVLGALVEIQAPSKLAFSTAEMHLKEELTQLITEKTDALAESTQVVAEQIQAVESNMNTSAEVVAVIASEMRTLAECTKAIGDYSLAVGEYTKAVASKTEAIGEKVEAIGAENKVVGESAKIVGESAKIAGSDEQVMGGQLKV